MRYERSDTDPALTDLVSRIKANLSLETDDYAARLADLAATVYRYCEGRDGILGRALILRNWTVTGSLPDLYILRLPVITAVGSVEVWTGTTFSSVTGFTWQPLDHGFAALNLDDVTWPFGADTKRLRVSFSAGYGATLASVPMPIVQAMVMMASDLFENRLARVTAQTVENPAVGSLLAPYRVMVF